MRFSFLLRRPLRDASGAFILSPARLDAGRNSWSAMTFLRIVILLQVMLEA